MGFYGVSSCLTRDRFRTRFPFLVLRVDYGSIVERIFPWRHTKLVAIISVISDTSLNFIGLLATTFKSTVDSLNGCPKALVYNRVHIGHLKPQGSLERYNWVIGHRFRRV
ncbi:hypothetical protein WN943_006963 [Citrus x changshan-huyou]